MNGMLCIYGLSSSPGSSMLVERQSDVSKAPEAHYWFFLGHMKINEL